MCAIFLFRTENLKKEVARLRKKGVTFMVEIETAPGFMRHIALTDPDNNLLYFAEYLSDPLEAHPR